MSLREADSFRLIEEQNYIYLLLMLTKYHFQQTIWESMAYKPSAWQLTNISPIMIFLFEITITAVISH